MLLDVATYEDAQYQSTEPIGPQPPIPQGVQDIELSWDRKAGYMRVVIKGQTWHFKEYLGKAEILGTDNPRGRLYLRAIAILDGETLIMYRDPHTMPHPLTASGWASLGCRLRIEGLRSQTTHNRLCYRRSSQDWRLRDERMPWNHPEALKFVTSYVGDMSAEWNRNDSIAHIFHNGYVIIDSDNICHLYDPDLVYD
jgi:hypothetical protein